MIWMLTLVLGGPATVLTIYLVIGMLLPGVTITADDVKFLFIVSAVTTLFASPFSAAVGALGAAVAVHIAKRRAHPWSRLKWAAGGAASGLCMLTAIAVFLFPLFGPGTFASTNPGDPPPFAIVLPFVGSFTILGALAASMSYKYLESITPSVGPESKG